MASRPVTRKRARTTTPEPTDMDLRTIVDEIRQLKDDQIQRERDFTEMLRLRDEEIQRLKEQISPSNNNRILVETASGSNIVNGNVLGFKLKPDTYDGTVPLREFLAQFEFIARANNWDENSKTIALASCLRRKARAILETIENFFEINYSEIKSKLELQFGEGHLSQNYFIQEFSNRKQKHGEDLAFYGAELERIARRAYPECAFVVRDKIACAQFINGISEFFIKRTLQLEGIISLKAAIERAKMIKIIQGENLEKRKELNFKFEKKNNYYKEKDNHRQNKTNFEKEKGKEEEKDKIKKREGKFYRQNKGTNQKSIECWSCGKIGHFRFECPLDKGNSV